MKTKGLAIIIGGSSGMGLEIAKKIIPNDYTIHIMGRDTEKLEKAILALKNMGADVEASTVDLYE